MASFYFWEVEANLVSSFKCYLKHFFEFYPRRIFEEGGDMGRGCGFDDPPPYAFRMIHCCLV